MLPGLLAAALLAASSPAAVVPADAPCVPVGDHTDRIPDFDPTARSCAFPAYASEPAFDAAWGRLVLKVRAGGGPLMPVDDEVQQAVGRGNVRAETLDEARHWGDLAYVQSKAAGSEPLAVYAVTYRAHRAGDALMAVRWDFQADGRGRLVAVHVWHGVRLKGAPAMAWSQGPVMTINQDTMLEGLWSIRFRRLVRSWAD